MLIIRPEQVAAFEAPMRDRFEQRMIAHLRTRFHARLESKTDDQLLPVIRVGIAQANNYGVTREYDVRRYLEYFIHYGDGFDKLDWAWPILVPPGKGTRKMNDLDGVVAFRVRPS